MAKRLTITNTRDDLNTPWYFQTNPPQNNTLNNWLQNNADTVTFNFNFTNSDHTQILTYTFADDTIAEEFSAFAASGNLASVMDNYHASVGITSTRTITDL